MTSPSVPVEGAARPRPRTRPATRWTDVYLILTLVFGVWGVGLVILTVVAIARPSFFYSDEKALIKAAAASVVALLALSQTYTMYAAMGKLPKAGIKMKYLMRGHRYGWRIALVLAALVAFFCMTDLGAPLSPLRAAIHGFFGGTAFAAIAIKLILIRKRPQFAYDAAPWLGGYAAGAFVVV